MGPWHKCFPVNLAKFLRTPFLQTTSGQLFLLLAFQKQPPEVKKGVLENFAKFKGKQCGWRNFQEHHFYTTALDDCFWLFPATLPKWDTANSVWKTSDEYSVPRKTNLKSTVQYDILISFLEA